MNNQARLIEIKSTQVTQESVDELTLINPEKILTVAYVGDRLDIWFDSDDLLQFEDKSIGSNSRSQLEKYIGSRFPQKPRTLTLDNVKIDGYVDGYDFPRTITQNVLNLSEFEYATLSTDDDGEKYLYIYFGLPFYVYPLENKQQELYKILQDIKDQFNCGDEPEDDTQFLEVKIHGISHSINKQNINYCQLIPKSNELRIYMAHDAEHSTITPYVFKQGEVHRSLQEIYDEIKRWKGGN